VKRMIFFVSALILFLTQPAFTSAILSNGESGEDSISISIHITDSLGNPAQTQADSFYVSVVGPSGDSITTVSGVASTAGLNVDSLLVSGIGWRYVYADAVDDIDGTGVPGRYEVTFCARDVDPGYVNCRTTSFQLVDDHLNDQLAAITTILDSLTAVLDSLKNQDDWVSAYDPDQDTVTADVCGLTEDGGQEIADAVLNEDTAGHQEAGSFAVLFKDTAAYQGSASGLTASEITDSVWDELQADHTAAGTFGNYLDAAVSSIETSTGSGTYPVTLTAFDSLNGQVIPGAKLSVYNISLSALVAVGITDTEGRLACNLDADSFVVSAFAPGYSFDAYDTLLITGDAVDTVRACPFDPGQPSSPKLCRVYGFLYSIDGVPIEDVIVSAELPEGGVRYGTLIISPYARTTVSNSVGYFYLDLIPSGDLDPAETPYVFSAVYPSGTILKRQIIVPDTSTWILDW